MILLHIPSELSSFFQSSSKEILACALVAVAGPPPLLAPWLAFLSPQETLSHPFKDQPAFLAFPLAAESVRKWKLGKQPLDGAYLNMDPLALLSFRQELLRIKSFYTDNSFILSQLFFLKMGLHNYEPTLFPSLNPILNQHLLFKMKPLFSRLRRASCRLTTPSILPQPSNTTYEASGICQGGNHGFIYACEHVFKTCNRLLRLNIYQIQKRGTLSLPNSRNT